MQMNVRLIFNYDTPLCMQMSPFAPPSSFAKPNTFDLFFEIICYYFASIFWKISLQFYFNSLPAPSLIYSSCLLTGEEYYHSGTFLNPMLLHGGQSRPVSIAFFQLQVQTCSNCNSYLHQYCLTIMIQCYFIVLFIIYSAPLVNNAIIPHLDPLPPGPSKPPFLPDSRTPWGRKVQWVLLFFQVFLLGILAGLIISVMGADKIHLRIWMNTGGEKQRSILDLHISIYTTNSL